jgi:hypothetical protein
MKSEATLLTLAAVPALALLLLLSGGGRANNPANHIHSVWRNIKGDFGLSN